MATYAFETLCHTSPTQWQAETLRGCTNKELRMLATLLVVPGSGSRVRLIARLLDIADVRTTVSDWQEPGAVAEAYKLKELRSLAQRAGTFRWSTKYGVAAGLMTWRNQCRRKGQTALREAREASAGQTRQLRLHFD